MSGREVDLSDNFAFGEGFPHAMFTWLRDNDPGSLARRDAEESRRRRLLGRQPLPRHHGSLPDAGDFFLEHRR